jgi:nitroreductase
MNDTVRLLRSHRSIRAYSGAVLDDAVVAEVVSAGLCAATSSNVQATTVIRVRSEATRERIAALAGGQQHIVTAGAFLVYCADLRRAGRAAARHGAEAVVGMTEQFVIATVDVALAAQNTVVAAESLGLGVCYIGAIRNDPQTVTDLLELPDQVYPVFGLCIGEPAQDPEVKPRLPLAAVLHEERYTETSHALLADYDDTMRTYYRTRSGGTKESSWSEEMAGLVGSERRPHMRDFLARQGFSLR